MIFVTGASGDVGQKIIKILSKENTLFSAGVRYPDKYQGIPCENIKHFDYNNIQVMVKALVDVDTLIFISGNCDTKERILQHRNIIDAANIAGVSHIIYLSFVTVLALESRFSFTRQHIDTESYLLQSGISHTIARCNWYLDNLSSALIDSLQTGVYIDAAKKGKISFITKDDVAAGLAKIALNPQWQQRSYLFSSDKSYSLQDIVNCISHKSGKVIIYKPITEQDYEVALSQSGMPNYLSNAIAANTFDIENDNYDINSNDLKNILGRDLKTIENYIENLCNSNLVY